MMRRLTPASARGRYAPVRGLARGLSVLRAINYAPRIEVTAADIASLTGLHRTTAQRLLETLLREGYLRQGEGRNSYRLADQVCELSAGYSYPERVCQIAGPIMLDLVEQLIWPSSLCSIAGNALIIRQTTHGMSRASFHHDMVGQRAPVLLTAAGRVCFVFMAPRRRNALLKVLGARSDAQGALARNRLLVRELVSRVRADGYSLNAGDWTDEPRTGAIAAPILHRGQAVAALNVVYLTTALGPKEAVRRFLPALREATARIARTLALEEDVADL